MGKIWKPCADDEDSWQLYQFVVDLIQYFFTVNKKVFIKFNVIQFNHLSIVNQKDCILWDLLILFLLNKANYSFMMNIVNLWWNGMYFYYDTWYVWFFLILWENIIILKQYTDKWGNKTNIQIIYHMTNLWSHGFKFWVNTNFPFNIYISGAIFW